MSPRTLACKGGSECLQRLAEQGALRAVPHRFIGILCEQSQQLRSFGRRERGGASANGHLALAGGTTGQNFFVYFGANWRLRRLVLNHSG